MSRPAIKANKKPAHLVSLLLNEPLNYDRMLDISTDELEFLKIECDSVMDELKHKIAQEYELIKPHLFKMREWKQQLQQLREKREVYRTFLSLDKNESLMSTSSAPSETNKKQVSFSELFRDLENDQEGSPNTGPPPKPETRPDSRSEGKVAPNIMPLSMQRVKSASLFTSKKDGPPTPRRTAPPNSVTLNKK